MGIRDWANRHPQATTAVIGVFIAVAIGVLVYEIVGNRRGYRTKPPDSYFSADDGKSYFVDSSERYPPFDHNGAQAVHAYVFQCGSTKFVGFLERYIPEVKRKLDAGSPLTPQMVRFGREVKRPGDANWVRTGDMATETKIENVGCPDGKGGIPDEIEP